MGGSQSAVAVSGGSPIDKEVHRGICKEEREVVAWLSCQALPQATGNGVTEQRGSVYVCVVTGEGVMICEGGGKTSAEDTRETV